MLGLNANVTLPLASTLVRTSTSGDGLPPALITVKSLKVSPPRLQEKPAVIDKLIGPSVHIGAALPRAATRKNAAATTITFLIVCFPPKTSGFVVFKT
jgi:hypothetical protein